MFAVSSGIVAARLFQSGYLVVNFFPSEVLVSTRQPQDMAQNIIYSPEKELKVLDCA